MIHVLNTVINCQQHFEQWGCGNIVKLHKYQTEFTHKTNNRRYVHSHSKTVNFESQILSS